jgi:hypothetical protein
LFDLKISLDLFSGRIFNRGVLVILIAHQQCLGCGYKIDDERRFLKIFASIIAVSFSAVSESVAQAKVIENEPFFISCFITETRI